MILFFCLLFTDGDVLWEINNEDLSSFISRFNSVVVTETEEVFIFDWREQRVLLLDASGKEIKFFGRKGEGPGEMTSAYRMQYNAKLKQLFLNDNHAENLYVFSKTGTYGDQEWPNHKYSFVIDKARLIYVDGPGFRTPPNQGAKVILANPGQKTSRTIYENDAKRHQDPGRVGGKDGFGSIGFTWDSRTLIHVSPNLRWLALGSNVALDFAIFDFVQEKFVSQVKADDVVRHPLSDDELDANKSEIRISGKVYTVRDFPQPDFKPPVADIFFDTASRLWVKLTSAWQAKHSDYRIHARDGVLLGKFRLHGNGRIVHASADHLWITRYDAEADIHYLKKRTYQLKH